MKTPVIFDSCLLLHRAIFAIPIPGIGRDERGHWQFDPIIYHRGDIGTDPKEDNMWRRLGLITIALLAILAGLAHGETVSAKDSALSRAAWHQTEQSGCQVWS